MAAPNYARRIWLRLFSAYRMSADAPGSSSSSVPELQRQLSELGEQLRVRNEAEGFALKRERAFAEILGVQ